jgi:hypothetical protein
MIPASYLYKDAFTQAWGDPSNPRPEPVACDPPGPRGGHLVTLGGLVASVLPLEVKRRRAMRA